MSILPSHRSPSIAPKTRHLWRPCNAPLSKVSPFLKHPHRQALAFAKVKNPRTSRDYSQAYSRRSPAFSAALKKRKVKSRNEAEITTVVAEVDQALEASVANRIGIEVSALRRATQKIKPRQKIVATRMTSPNAANGVHEAAAVADATETTRRITRQPRATTIPQLRTAVAATKIADVGLVHVTAIAKTKREASRIQEKIPQQQKKAALPSFLGARRASAPKTRLPVSADHALT
jgi:leucyl aminopeptidase